LQHGAAVVRCLCSRHGSARSSTATADPLPRCSFGEGKAELGLNGFKGQPQHCQALPKGCQLPNHCPSKVAAEVKFMP